MLALARRRFVLASLSQRGLLESLPGGNCPRGLGRGGQAARKLMMEGSGFAGCWRQSAWRDAALRGSCSRRCSAIPC